MKRVLVVSYFYPPYSSVGATRVSKMTRYLSDAGWQAHVLTVDGCDLPETLPLEVPAERVTRTPQLFDLASLPRAVVGRQRLAQGRTLPTQTKRWTLLWRAGEIYRHVVCFPDGQIGWWRGAAARGVELARQIQPDVILSSSLPNTSHLVARSIARATGRPWVAELRDLWTRNHNFRRVQPLRAIERRLERSVLREASALVTVSEVWADWLRAAYGRPTFVVPNGYDPNDYPDVAPPAAGPFVLTYTGMFYNGKQNVAPLLDAVARLASRGIVTPQRLRVRFVGQYLGPVLAQAHERGLDAFVEVKPPVPYTESLRLQRSAHALLFLDWFAGGAEGWYSAKIYEYLGAGRPILSIGRPDSVVARLLGDARVGVTCADSDAVANVLECWLREYESCGRIRYNADEAVRAGFHRQQAARAMAGVLDEVISHAR